MYVNVKFSTVMKFLLSLPLALRFVLVLITDLEALRLEFSIWGKSNYLKDKNFKEDASAKKLLTYYLDYLNYARQKLTI